eukprot:759497-Hanusia_phi.AAC.2
MHTGYTRDLLTGKGYPPVRGEGGEGRKRGRDVVTRSTCSLGLAKTVRPSGFWHEKERFRLSAIFFAIFLLLYARRLHGPGA